MVGVVARALHKTAVMVHNTPRRSFGRPSGLIATRRSRTGMKWA
jgi:hypothetical protein